LADIKFNSKAANLHKISYDFTEASKQKSYKRNGYGTTTGIPSNSPWTPTAG
jgi:hypothetical protein